jgi:hypothetical protein
MPAAQSTEQATPKAPLAAAIAFGIAGLAFWALFGASFAWASGKEVRTFFAVMAGTVTFLALVVGGFTAVLARDRRCRQREERRFLAKASEQP